MWEAVIEPALSGLGRCTWIVDVNRQSLDRVVPGIRIRQYMDMLEANGWTVFTAKYGDSLNELMERPGGDALRRRIDDMPNEEYQSLFAFHGDELRKGILANGSSELTGFLAGYTDDELGPLVHNLGGHDLRELLRAYRACDAVDDRPSVVFAYTIKGWGLPFAGDPLNHAALLNRGQKLSGRADVKWSVDKPEVLAVLADGTPERRRLRARAAGSATVTVALDGVTSSLEVEVQP